MTQNAERLAADYVDVLGATFVDQSDLDPEFGALLGIGAAQGRAVGVTFGEQLVDLIEVSHPAGRGYPAPREAHDLAFQHFALAVTDIRTVHARLDRSLRYSPITRDGPVRLPAATGGVTAFKFRDVEGHPIELLEFPDTGSESGAGGSRPSGDRAGGASWVTGLDHTAISVSDTRRTTQFFEQLFGFTAVGHTFNHGEEQARLDCLTSPQVDVTALRAGPLGPGVELLHYHGVRRREHVPVAANDVAATHTVFSCASVDDVLDALHSSPWDGHAHHIVTGADGRRVLAVRDPDGHRLLVEETG